AGFFLSLIPRPSSAALFPYTTLFRSSLGKGPSGIGIHERDLGAGMGQVPGDDLQHLSLGLLELVRGDGPQVPLHHRVSRDHVPLDRKSTRLNSSHDQTPYAVSCLKKK